MVLESDTIYKFGYDVRFLRYLIFLPLCNVGLNTNGKPTIGPFKGKFLYCCLFVILMVIVLAYYCRISVKNYQVQMVEDFYAYYFAGVLIISFGCLLITIYTQNKLLDLFFTLDVIDRKLKNRFSLCFSYTVPMVLTYITIISAYILLLIEAYISLAIYKRSIFDLLHMFVYLITTIHRSLPMFVVTLIYILVNKKLDAMDKVILEFTERKDGPSILIADLSCLMECHRKLIKCVNLIFQMYGMPIALNLLTTTLPAALFLASITLYKPPEVVELYEFVVLNFILVIPVCAMAYQVIEKFAKIGRSLCEIELAYTDKKLAEIKILFLLQILHDNVQNSAGGLFKIDATLIPVICAGVGTMALFIIQMVNIFGK